MILEEYKEPCGLGAGGEVGEKRQMSSFCWGEWGYGQLLELPKPQHAMLLQASKKSKWED